MPIPEKVIVPAAKDPGRGHFYVSLVKSVFRIGAGTALVFGIEITGGVVVSSAVILGIIEEIV